MGMFRRPRFKRRTEQTSGRQNSDGHEAVTLDAAAPVHSEQSPLVQSEEVHGDMPLLAGLRDLVGSGHIVPVSQVVPNPHHPRHDWRVENADLKLLAKRLTSADTAVEPLVCTLLGETSSPLATGARFALINGHRRLAAAQCAGIEKLQVRVLRHADGRPLTMHEQLAYWLLVSRSGKKPTVHHTAAGIVLWHRALSAGDGGAAATALHLPTQREIAELLQVAVGTVNRALRIAEEPKEIVAAVVTQSIQLEAAVKLIDVVQDAQQRVELVREVLQHNAQRRTVDAGPLTVRQILDLAQHGTLDPVSLEQGANEHKAPDAAATAAYAPDSGPPSLELVHIQTPTKARARAPLKIMHLLEENPEPTDVEILYALTCDIETWFSRLIQTGVPLPRPLRRPYRMLSNPDVVDALSKLIIGPHNHHRRRSGRLGNQVDAVRKK
jgi:hypothetical protein